MIQIFVGPCKLPLLRHRPAFPHTGHGSSAPAVGQELIEHNKRPSQSKQRIQSIEPWAKSWIVAIKAFRAMTKALALWQHNWRARMQKATGGEVHAAMPTKILEVEK